jgi:hypothetical protein
MRLPHLVWNLFESMKTTPDGCKKLKANVLLRSSPPSNDVNRAYDM